MIKDKEVAQQVSRLMLEFGGRLDASIALVMDRCSDGEFESYRAAVGRIMGEMLIEVMNPLYREHPELKPKELN